jgi:RNA polymerase sigma factor FliA
VVYCPRSPNPISLEMSREKQLRFPWQEHLIVLTDSGQSQNINEVVGRTLNEFNNSDCFAESAAAITISSVMRPRRRRIQSRDRRQEIPCQDSPLQSALPDKEADLAAKHAGIERTPRLTAAQDELVVEHLPLVRFIARRIHGRLPQQVLLEELFSAGVVGLMDAGRKFDPLKETKFSTYAQFRIRGAILDYLRSLDWAPRELRLKRRAIEEVIQRLTARLERAPDEAEIAQELGTDLADYHSLLDELNGLEIGSLHERRWEDSDEEELAYLPSAPEDDPLFRCLTGEMRQRLIDAIDALPERERLVLTLYYYEELTMKDIALALNVAASRASQLHASAVLRLQSRMAKQGVLDRRRAAPNGVTSLPARLDPRKRNSGLAFVGSPALEA